MLQDLKGLKVKNIILIKRQGKKFFNCEEEKVKKKNALSLLIGLLSVGVLLGGCKVKKDKEKIL